jgi:hypothetical protein
MDYYLAAIGIVVASTIFLVSKILQICVILLWRPYVLTGHFKKQGIIGPPCSIEMKKLKIAAGLTVLDANSHDITPRVFPHYHRWSSCLILVWCLFSLPFTSFIGGILLNSLIFKTILQKNTVLKLMR